MILSVIKRKAKKGDFKTLVEHLHDFILVALVFGCKCFIFGQYTFSAMNKETVVVPGMLFDLKNNKDLEFRFVEYFENREEYLQSLFRINFNWAKMFIEFNDLVIISTILNVLFILFYVLFLFLFMVFGISKCIQLAKLGLSYLQRSNKQVKFDV